MNQFYRLVVFAFVAGGFLMIGSTADGHMIFKKRISEKYKNMKVTCNTCHVPKAKKTERNSFGKVFAKTINNETMTADWKSKSGVEKKAFENDVMAPAFEKAFEKIQKMTFNDMVEAGLVDGMTPKEEK